MSLTRGVAMQRTPDLVKILRMTQYEIKESELQKNIPLLFKILSHQKILMLQL
jgi:hypothetical protein